MSILDDNNSFVGGLTDEDLNILLRYMRKENSKLVLEVGTLFGITANRISELGVDVITADNFAWNPFGLTRRQHIKFTQRILRTDVRLVVLDISLSLDEQCKALEEELRLVKVDTVFIDADHTYDSVLRDIKMAHRLGASNIVVHDYDKETHIEVVTACNYFYETHKADYYSESEGNFFFLTRH